MPFSNYLDTKILDWLLEAVSYTPPTTIYIGLSSTQPSQVAGGSAPYWNITEVSGNGYTPEGVTSNTSDWAAISAEPTGGYVLQNNGVITFPTSTGAWNGGQPIGYFFAKDGSGALNPGTVNMLFFGSLSPNENVATSGVSLEFPIGQLTTSLN
jgi:hypothetical protein